MGGTYLGNTPLRQRLPFVFRVIDAENQVIQFDRPLYRIMGQDAGTAFLPPDLVVELGTLVLQPGTGAPDALVVEIDAGGFGPPIARRYPDVEQAVWATHDEYHRIVAGTETVLNQEAVERAGYYARKLADTFQTADGTGRVYSGIRNIKTDGKTRQVVWEIADGTVQTMVGANCEVSRVVLPLAARRLDESLAPDAVRGLENLNTDWKRAGAFANAMRWMIGKLTGGNNQ